MAASNKETFRYGNPNFILAKIAYSQAIKKGEMLKLASATGLCTPCTAANNNDTFFCIADQDHAALSVDDSKEHTVRAIIPDPSCVFEYDLNGSPSPSVGTGLAIYDSQTLKLASTDHIAVAVETKASATKCKVVFLTPPLWGGASQNVSFESV